MTINSITSLNGQEHTAAFLELPCDTQQARPIMAVYSHAQRSIVCKFVDPQTALLEDLKCLICLELVCDQCRPVVGTCSVGNTPRSAKKAYVAS